MNIVVIEPLGISAEKADKALKPLRDAGHNIKCYETRTEDENELVQRGKDAEIIILANLPFKKNVLEKCEKLKMISVAFTGVDHIDVDFCREKGITVCNAAGYSTNAVAELTFGLALSVLRNIPKCDSATRAGGTKAGLVGCELFGKTFGVVGTGAIGSRVCAIAKVFGCDVVAYSRTEKEELKNSGVKYLSLDELLEKSDIVSLHVPATKETSKLIGKNEIDHMKKNAVLINAARGAVIDGQALADALDSGQIAGAGIDVFETEPPIEKENPLLNCKNTVLTPHVAFASEEALYARAKIVVDNIVKWQNGSSQNLIC
ncbi:MAG: hydroxyacid dehydrogenase [Firmicutes bacterium]|nr:hydroxyacid dehydrogenase [Bacillota bacterium]